MDVASDLVTVDLVEGGWPLAGVRLGETLRVFDGRVTGVVESDQGWFVYKLIPGPVENAERSGRVLEFLEQRSFVHAPRLLRARQEQRALALDHAALILLEHLDGREPAPTPASYRQLGRILGGLNSIEDCPDRCRITLAAIRPAWSELAGALNSRADRDEFLAVADCLPNLDALPRSLIHFEMSLDNTIQKPDGTIVAVDWDQAGTGPRVFDPGYFLITAFVSESLVFDLDGARAFYAGYLSRMRLSDAEIAALFDASVFHALRYLGWGDPEARWRRIRWAIEQRSRLESVLS